MSDQNQPQSKKPGRGRAGQRAGTEEAADHRMSGPEVLGMASDGEMNGPEDEMTGCGLTTLWWCVACMNV
jgi:hypothetical protein